MTTLEELEKLARLLAEAKAARAACTVDAPESVWQVKDHAEAAWDAATNYADPDAAINALPELVAMAKELDAARAQLAGVREASTVFLQAADQFEGEDATKKLYLALRVGDLRRLAAVLAKDAPT
jgi:hypothetical protein